MNILSIPPGANKERPEYCEALYTGKDNLLVERIISHGHTTPEGEWYDQEHDEWVLVLEGSASIAYENGEETPLAKGDTLFLPRHVKHRVSYTSSPCLWLAVYAGELNPLGSQ